jgi:hypothetical protein
MVTHVTHRHIGQVGNSGIGQVSDFALGVERRTIARLAPCRSSSGPLELQALTRRLNCYASYNTAAEPGYKRCLFLRWRRYAMLHGVRSVYLIKSPVTLGSATQGIGILLVALAGLIALGSVLGEIT